MKDILFKITVLTFGVSLFFACSKKESLNETFIRINQEVLQNSKAYSTLKEATSTIGHRLTGSENGKKAEEYTFGKFKEYGFDDVKFQEFEVEAWSRGDVSVTIDGAPMPAVLSHLRQHQHLHLHLLLLLLLHRLLHLRPRRPPPILARGFPARPWRDCSPLPERRFNSTRWGRRATARPVPFC